MGIEDQLNAFKAGLDNQKGPRVIPGFLFRHGEDVTLYDYSRRDITEILDEGLLEYQTEIYRQALEVRNQILENIKPHEILDMVKDIWRAWDGSKIEHTWEGANVAYHYPRVIEEWQATKTTERRFTPMTGHDSFTTTNYDTTGMWRAQWLSARQEVVVLFGYADQGLSSDQLDEFFADYYSRSAPRFKGVPRTIWRRPDNLGILTVNKTTDIRLDDHTDAMWFGQYTSQQDIKDSLWQKLKAQEVQGQLPYQIAELEYAKIEELRKRGLFIESPR